MGVIVPTGFAQVSLFFRQDGGSKEYVTTLGTDLDGVAPTTAIIEDIIEAFNQEGGLLEPTQILDEYHWSGIRVSYETGTGPLVIDSTGADIVDGTRTGSPMPVNVAMLSKKQTGAGGRRGRGRSYWPPMFLGETEVDGNGNIDETRLESINTAMSLSLGTFSLTVGPAVLFHSDGGTPDPLTDWVMQPVVATQRRRLRR